MCILLLNTLESSLRDCVPVRWVCFALLKEVNKELSSLVTMVGINVVSRFSMHDDLSRTTIECGKCWQSTSHGFNHCQPKSFINCRLNKSTLCVTNHTVQFSISNSVHLRRDPSELPIQLVGLDQAVHLLHLSLLFQVLRLLPPVSGNNNQVHQLPEPRVLAVPLHKSRDVLHTVKSCHGEDDWLVAVLQYTSVTTMGKIIFYLNNWEMIKTRVEGTRKRNSHVFLVLHWAVKKLFNLRVEIC